MDPVLHCVPKDVTFPLSVFLNSPKLAFLLQSQIRAHIERNEKHANEDPHLYRVFLKSFIYLMIIKIDDH